ncbi:MAG TPA: acetate--CoA ligase family protein [Gammaproteobacteria bacterium]|nr:acetate--CoA ligase family protein [Gammaproteobacteria bacterium]
MNDSEIFRALFEPRTIALIGASGDERKNTARPQRFLARHGFDGRVVPVNPNRDEVLGARAYRSVADIPGGADHAFVMVPASSVAEAIGACGDAGIAVATIYSDGFAESGGDGIARQRDLVSLARSKDIRLLGPNSMGLVNLHNGMALTVNAVLELPSLNKGGLSVVSQSGSVIGTLLSRGQARGFGFSKLVSVGNECDLSVAEIVDHLSEDDSTNAVLLFLETLRNEAALGKAARKAFDAGKPVITYKLGRSEVGKRLAATHSGAMTGSSEAVDAWFRHHGVIRVDMLEGLIETPPLFINSRPPVGRRAAVMTTTGGGAATVADRLGSAGITLTPPPAPLVERMRAHRVDLSGRTLVDLTMAGTRPEIAREAIEALLDSPECDVVVVVVGSSGQFHPEIAVRPIIEAAGGSNKPVGVFILPEAGESLKLLADAGIAAFRTPEGCADGVRAYLDWRPPTVAVSRNERLLAKAGRQLSTVDNGTLDERAAGELFESVGIRVAPSVVIENPRQPVDLHFPVAVKLLSSRVSHKTDVGGVILDLMNRESVEAACREIGARLRQRRTSVSVDGFLVQEMVAGLAEALVGFHRDAETGPVVIIGVGGTLTEMHRDYSVRVAPVTFETACEMIEEVRGLAAIRGYRGTQRGDLNALAKAVSALSQLAELDRPQVLEAEINPLVVKAQGEGVVAVDGVVRVGPAD